jgi:DNA-binding NtrC family response regulator
VVPASAARGTETILVVEDQKEVRDLTARVLRHYGYNVHACASGEEGLHFSHRFEGPIDLLVSDVIMPGMNGMALARAMTLQRRSMRILLMSGYTDDALTQGAIVEEGIAYLQKPFTPEQLATKVREMFREESKGPGQDGRLA